MYGFDDSRFCGIIFYTFAELGNVLVEGAAGGVVAGAPALIEKGVPV